MSNVVIPREHQSAPKETDADKAVREARQDIADGRFVPTQPEGIDGFFDDGESTWLAQHPKVQEALAKLEVATNKKTGAEYVEKAEMLHEANAMVRSKAKWDGQGRWQGRENHEKRMVRPIHPYAFLKRLQRWNVKATVRREEGSRIWLGEFAVRLLPKIHGAVKQPGALIGVYAELTGDAAKEAHYGTLREFSNISNSGGMAGLQPSDFAELIAKYNEAKRGYYESRPAVVRVAALQDGVSPEWSLYHFDQYDVPTSEKYHGWRTCLLSLILRGVLTEQEAHSAFGMPTGQASEFYREQLFAYRNRMGGNA